MITAHTTQQRVHTHVFNRVYRPVNAHTHVQPTICTECFCIYNIPTCTMYNIVPIPYVGKKETKCFCSGVKSGRCSGRRGVGGRRDPRVRCAAFRQPDARVCKKARGEGRCSVVDACFRTYIIIVLEYAWLTLCSSCTYTVFLFCGWSCL